MEQIQQGARDYWHVNRGTGRARGFVLFQTLVDDMNLSDEKDLIQQYHTGKLDNACSRNLCKRAMGSKHGFYWLAKQHHTISTDLPLHSAIAFHIPRDNINSDVFLVVYSNNYMKYSQTKLDFLVLMSQACCFAAFSPALLFSSKDDDETSTVLDNSKKSHSYTNPRTYTPPPPVSVHTTIPLHPTPLAPLGHQIHKPGPTIQLITTGLHGPSIVPAITTTTSTITNTPASSKDNYDDHHPPMNYRIDRVLDIDHDAAVVEVSEHIPMDRIVEVDHVRRSSLCIQEPFTLEDLPTDTDNKHHENNDDDFYVGDPSVLSSPISSDGLEPMLSPFLGPVATIDDNDDINKAAEEALKALEESNMTLPPRHPIYRNQSNQSENSESQKSQYNESQKSNMSPFPQISPGNYNVMSHPPRFSTSPSPDIDDAASQYLSVNTTSDNSPTPFENLNDRFFNVKHHPVNLNDLEKSICEGSQHSRGSFSYHVNKLSINRQLNHNVDLSEFHNMAYLTEGSNSHIFNATWNNQPVIVKMLQPSKQRDSVALHEFDIECELLSRLDHPNVVKLLGSGKIPRPYLILECLRDVSEILGLNTEDDNRPSIFNRRKFNYMEVLQLAKDLADAVNYIHNEISPLAMIIHRDIKPDNIGLTSEGRLKLFDFGLCRCVKKSSDLSATYAMTGHTGSLRYMAPEVVLDQPYNEKVDVYRFNRAKHHANVVVAGGRPKLESGWPSAFRELLSQCWHQDPHQRPSFKEISKGFAAILIRAQADAAKGTTHAAKKTARSALSSLFGVANR